MTSTNPTDGRCNSTADPVIRELWQRGMNAAEIHRECVRRGYTVSDSTVYNRLKEFRRAAAQTGAPLPVRTTSPQ